MFENIGEKLKGLAIFECWIGIIGSIIWGIIAINANTLTGILIIILGPLASWISSWITYAIGEIADNTSQILFISKQNNTKKPAITLPKIFPTVKKPTGTSSLVRKPCPYCGASINSNTCDVCGQPNNLF